MLHLHYCTSSILSFSMEVYVLVLLMKWDPGGEEMCYIDRTVPSEAKTIPQVWRGELKMEV